MVDIFEKVGIHIPEIMLPANSCDYGKWSVIACDQYTSQPEYWEKVEKLVGNSPSTFHITLPEIYLKDENVDKRVQSINSNMEKYIRQQILAEQKPGFILVDRCTPHAPSRKGLIMAVDLEMYSYAEGSQSPIRATEGTVLERIPPRVRIRENAPIELPHILVLVDDPGRTLIEPLYERAGSFTKLYDFELMLDGGHIRGWKVDDEQSLSMIASALEKLGDPDLFKSKYALEAEKEVLLFAVGDGNHSLASAKAHWENVKSRLEPTCAGCLNIPVHPARYALVEVVNVHDEGIVFEPIHRILFGIDSASVLEEMIHPAAGLKNAARCETQTTEIQKASYKLYKSKDEMEKDLRYLKDSSKETVHAIPLILEGTYGMLVIENPACNLEVGSLQALLDEFLNNNEQVEIDYIHGDDVVTGIGSKPRNLGFYLPPMNKYDFFRSVIMEGTLPRKTFSMGEAEEKRYYLECRRIR